MNIPYPRPTTLSDPHHDFWPDFGTELLVTPDREFNWVQLKNILGPFLPAGTYEESVYFLPLTFERLRYDGEDAEGGTERATEGATKDDALNLTTSVIWFVSEYAEELARDGLLDECRRAIADCLQHWTRDFTVIHYDRGECAAKGHWLPYLDYVLHSNVLCTTLCDLDRFERHADLADTFIADLVASPQPVSSAWFLEMARARIDYVDDLPVRESFTRLFADAALIARKRRIVEGDATLAAIFPTYWRDVFDVIEQKPPETISRQ